MNVQTSSLICPICIDTLDTNNIISLQCCNNTVHIECFYKWIQEVACCPICRDETNLKLNLEFLIIHNEVEIDANRETLPLINRSSYTSTNIHCLKNSLFYVIIVIAIITLIYNTGSCVEPPTGEEKNIFDRSVA